MNSFPFGGKQAAPESETLHICETERMRQWRMLIMIPSESICCPAAAEVLALDMGNLYAEGQPPPILCHDPRESAADTARFGSWQTRLSDRRFYKGTVNANRIELAACRNIAEVFATLEGSPESSDIYVNVQALSGAAANIATLEALLEPGDPIMGLDLAHGGHLTHGSEFNISGKIYRAHSYGVDDTTRRLDYAQIREQARTVQPKLIIGGASSYPWDFDWAMLREIADEVGAYLLADVAHLAGMIAAGLLNNPVPHAHAVTFTTHKTLCGPRGAVILSADPELAAKIDAGVFPNLQGGPHMNSIAAISRLFELILADYNGFRALQQSVLNNSRYFAQALTGEGFTLEYGGTNTHMLLVDMKRFPVEGETFLDGEIASRLLEIAGIVCNKNVLPGDPDGAHASGLRFGLPWLTQRGVTCGQLGEIAKIIRSVLKQVRTITIWSPTGDKKCRGRLPSGVLEEAGRRTLSIAEALSYPEPPPAKETPPPQSKIGDRTAFIMRGDKVRLALSQMLTARLPVNGGPVRADMFASDGSKIDDVIVAELEPAGTEQRWLVLPHHERAAEVRRWIENLSDGYILFDEADLQQKVDGPNVLEELDVALIPDQLAKEIENFAEEPQADFSKPYFIGQRVLYPKNALPAKGRYEYTPPDIPIATLRSPYYSAKRLAAKHELRSTSRRTVLNQVHHDLGAKMALFAGWEMPIQYPTGILAEHHAVRTAAGLFDVSHMGALEVSGPHTPEFLEALLANCVSRMAPGQAEYSCILYPNGSAIDDLYVYRLEAERFMIIMNAANAERVRDWVEAVNARRVIIDEEMPGKEIDGPVKLRDLRNAGPDSRIGLALQGPVSRQVLQTLAENSADRARLQRLMQSHILDVRLAGLPVLVARTGYTGERIGFEIYVHPDQAGDLWNAILDAGGPLGILPAGLGVRDATRLEAGFPLFGHELEGKLGISPTEAGYGFLMRFHVPFFIGRKQYMRRAQGEQRHIIRLQGQGRKTVRPGHLILDDLGKPAGQVTSFAYVHEDMTYMALACVQENFQPEPGAAVRGARVPAGRFTGEVDVSRVVELIALTRFPEEAEQEAWLARYAH